METTGDSKYKESIAQLVANSFKVVREGYSRTHLYDFCMIVDTKGTKPSLKSHSFFRKSATVRLIIKDKGN